MRSTPPSQARSSFTWSSRTSSTCDAPSNGAAQCHVTIAVPPGDWRFTVTENGYGSNDVIAARTAATVTIDVGG